MEVKDKNKIREEIESFTKEHGGNYSAYYIGITNNLDRRIEECIINEHIKSGLYDPNTLRYEAKAESRDIAFAIEKEFQDNGMERYNPGGKGKEDSQYIYCFKMKDRLNDGRNPDFGAIRGMIAEGKERVRFRWFKSFKKFFGLN